VIERYREKLQSKIAAERASLEQAKQTAVMSGAEIQGIETNLAWLENLLRQTAQDS
jgi:pyruvate carboxylase